MSLVLLSKQDDYDLTHAEQDCRGWTVLDSEGTELGKVTDLVVDTEAEHVASLVLDTGATIRAADVGLRDGIVTLRDGGATTGGAAATASAAASATAIAPRTAGRDDRRLPDVVVPVVEEQIRVGKRARDVEEVALGEAITERDERIRDTVTRTDVEQLGANADYDRTRVDDKR